MRDSAARGPTRAEWDAAAKADARRIARGLAWLYGVFGLLPTLAWWLGWPVWPLWVIVGPAALGLLCLAWAVGKSMET